MNSPPPEMPDLPSSYRPVVIPDIKNFDFTFDKWNYYETYLNPAVIGDRHNNVEDKILEKKRGLIKVPLNVLKEYCTSKEIKEYNLKSLKDFAKNRMKVLDEKYYSK